MGKKAKSGIMLTLLLTSILTLAFSIQTANASGTIHIRADGSVDPPTAPIQRNGNIYTFTDDIYESVVVEKDGIVIDGAGYLLQAFAESGINLAGRNNVTIQNMKIETSENGIDLFESSSNKIVGNNISNNWYGIWLDSSSNNSIVGNLLTANKDCGVYLCFSSNNNISENEFVDDGLIVAQSYGNKVSENFVNGKPLIYLENVTDYVVENAGQVILIDCSGIRVENLNLCNTVIGVDLERTNNTKISGNNIAGTKFDGISLSSSLNNSIDGNNVSNSWFCGLMLYSSLNNSVVGNHITDSPYGIWLSMSSNNTFRNNNLIDNRYNFYLRDVDFRAWSPAHFVNDVDVSNTVNGKPIYYWVKKQDAIIPSDAGYVALVNCTNITVENLSLEYNGQGMLLAFTERSTIRQNNVANNRGGMWLYKSSNNSIVGNNITANWYSIALFGSSSNHVYHNNFRENAVWDQAWDDPDIPLSTNVWNDGYPSGGNFWSDHVTVDDHSGINQDEPGRDGIVDEPYFIDEDNQDNYPLINPWVEREVGVNVGDWAKYVVETVGQHVPPELKDVDWIRNIVQDVSDATLLVEQLWHYKNGTEKTVTGYGSVVTSDSEMCVYFISKGLNPGDTVYATYPNENLPGLTKINETVSRECLGVNRETNHVNTTYRGTGYDAYWDRATGIMVEVKMSYLDTLLHLEIVETNLWGAPPTASATIDMDPHTLNLRSRGQWVTAYIQLPEKYNAADINATTVLLNGTISPVLDPKYEFVTNPSEYLVDHDGDGILERMVKFDKAEVMALLGVGEATLTITGEVNGEKFEGSDSIRVILPATGCGGCRGLKR